MFIFISILHSHFKTMSFIYTPLSRFKKWRNGRLVLTFILYLNINRDLCQMPYLKGKFDIFLFCKNAHFIISIKIFIDRCHTLLYTVYIKGAIL